jgi:hypothetical protein
LTAPFTPVSPIPSHPVLKAAHLTLTMEDSDTVQLNVGGTRYTTTWTTQKNRSENFLTKLVEHDRSGVMKAKRDENGS